MIRSVLLVTFTVASYAQVTAPQLGLISDGTALRPVAGIPAAAAVGAPLTFSRNLTQVTPSPTYALAVDAGSGEVLLLTSTAVPIANAVHKPDRIQLSPQSSAALLWFAATQHAQIVTGLPANPSVKDLDLSFIPEPPTALAVADDGTAAAIWPGIAYKFLSTGAEGLPLPNPIPALSFAPGSSDLALVSATDATLWKGSGTTSLAVFPNSQTPVGTAINSKNLFIADQSGIIVTVDLASGSLTSLDCQCTPQGLFPMNQSAYRVTAFNQAAFKLFDTKQNAIWFAPLALGAQQ